MADRIVVMNGGPDRAGRHARGALRAAGRPLFIADFVGRIESLPGTVRVLRTGAVAVTAGAAASGSGPAPGACAQGEQCVCAVRPEAAARGGPQDGKRRQRSSGDDAPAPQLLWQQRRSGPCSWPTARDHRGQTAGQRRCLSGRASWSRRLRPTTRCVFRPPADDAATGRAYDPGVSWSRSPARCCCFSCRNSSSSDRASTEISAWAGSARLTLDNYQDVLTDRFYLEAFARTVRALGRRRSRSVCCSPSDRLFARAAAAALGALVDRAAADLVVRSRRGEGARTDAAPRQ